jgi:micrococcal nuclease
MRQFALCGIILLFMLTACERVSVSTDTGSSGGDGESGRVVRVIDGDTIDVDVNAKVIRVRYVGVNTPERDEPCYQEATDANSRMVKGQIVRLVKDTSDVDRYDRPLRYVYVGDTFVNWELVKNGYAEAVLYEPDDHYYEDFKRLESQATLANAGCHPSGIFNDGSTTR